MATNISVPTKSPGSQHLSAELNSQVEYINKQGVNQGAFDPANIVIEGTGTYNNYSHATSTLTLNGAASTATSGDNYTKVKITFAVDCTISFSGSFDSVQLFGLPTSNLFSAGTYLFIFYHDPVNSSLGFIRPSAAAVETPVTFSNFTIEDANPDRVLFNADKIWTGTTFAGFTLADPTKTITSMVGSGTASGYFVVSAAYTSGDTSPTIAYGGTDDITSSGGDLASFTATAITNNVVAWVPADLGANLLFEGVPTDAGTGNSDSITDQSGNFTGTNPSQAVDSSRPAYSAGPPIIATFDNTNSEFWKTTSFAQMLAMSSGWFTYIHESSESNSRALSFYDVSDANYYVSTGQGGANLPTLAISYGGGASRNLVDFGSTALLAGDVVSFGSTGTAYRCYVNGLEVAANTPIVGLNNGDWIADVAGIDAWGIGLLREASAVYYNLVHKRMYIHNITNDSDIVSLHNYIAGL